MPVVNYTNKHRTALFDFVASNNNLNTELQELTRRTFQGVLCQPGVEPAKNCLVLEEEGRISGLAIVFREFPINRSIIEVMAAPGLVGGTEELELIRRAVTVAKSELPSVVHMCVSPDTGRGKLLRQLGFTQVRTYLDMLWSEESLPEADLPAKYSLRSFHEEDSALLTKIQNDAFTGSWGFCPNTDEQIKYRTRMPNTSKTGILFLLDGGLPAGYCWTLMVPSENGLRGAIGMIGVMPDYRGQGVSRHILHAGMRYLHSIGISEVGLEVDGNNAPAIRLYTSTGFKKIGERHWFELDLPGK